MTISRCRTAARLILPLLAAAGFGDLRAQESAPAGELLEDCNRAGIGPDPFARYECIGRNVARKEARLDRAFGAARGFIIDREAGALMEDIRRSPIYLDWSQAAWKEFVEQDCTVRAGLRGGSNAWVSREWTDCYSEELDRRIAFLEDIASGKFTAS